jgi:hypothetical protein
MARTSIGVMYCAIASDMSADKFWMRTTEKRILLWVYAMPVTLSTGW